VAVQATDNTVAITQELREACLRELTALASTLENRFASQVIDMGITASGSAGLAQSFVGRVEEPQPGVFYMAVESTRPYAAYVEFGTKPHFPPIRPLYAWVEKKLDITGYNVKYRTTFEGGQTTSRAVKMSAMRQFGTRRSAAKWKREKRVNRVKEILRIARAVQRKIGFKGTEPKGFMRKSLVSLNLPFTVIEQGTEKRYRINISEWLQGRPDIVKALGE
jgi:hypothetical protein